MIYIKSALDIKLIKKACEVWKIVMDNLIKNTRVGVNINDLDALSNKLATDNGASCAFYKYNGFPKHICISINDEIIHGVPRDYLIKNGDLITFDVGIKYQNRFCDGAMSLVVGDNDEANKILNACNACLINAIESIKPFCFTGDVGYVINKIAKAYGYEVMKEYGGHGCGIKIHEEPIILNYGVMGSGVQLQENMIICIEPMLMTGSDKFYIDNNKWTVKTKNHRLSCHVEHMVLITKGGCEVLTK